jgi:hypothetical protein
MYWEIFLMTCGLIMHEPHHAGRRIEEIDPARG